MIRLAVSVLLALVLVNPLAGQEESTDTAPEAVPTSPEERRQLLTSLQAFVDSLSAPPGYVREVFRYPRFGRLDPVEPPPTVTKATAFPELSLTGIVFDEADPARSAAILRVTRDGETDRRVVRAGDTIDQYRIVGVEAGQVLIDVYLYGGVRRLTLDRSDRGDERTNRNERN